MDEIKKTIQDVLEAEKKADQIIEDANRESKEIAMNAAQEVAEIKAKSEAAIKNSVKELIADGERRASVEYDAIVKEGQAQADLLKQKAQGNIEEVSDYIVKKFIEGVKVNYGNN